MGQIITTRFGAAALSELARALERGGDPLAPGLVVCNGPLVAVGTRRALAAREGGIAGVDFVTPDRLIEELSRNRLAALGQRPATSLELQSALRAELAAHPGRFGSVASHRTTEDRLLRLDRELVGLPRPPFKRLQQAGGLAGDALRALAGAAERLGSGRHGSACVASEVVGVALESLGDLPLGARGPIVIFLPEPVLPYEGRLLAALARRDDCTVLLGLTGHSEIDRRHLGRMSGWGLPSIAPPPPEVQVPFTGARVLEVADPEDEVRSAVRELTAHAATGIALSRMALLYTATDPYASLIAEHLEASGLPFSAPGFRPLSRSLAGRTLLRLIGLAESGLERSAFITLVSAAPLRLAGGQPVPASEWDRLSRQAGVVDADDWQPRLSRLATHLDSSDRGAAESLIEFVTGLSAALHPDQPPTTWRDWSGWAGGLLRSLLERGDSAQGQSVQGDSVQGQAGWPESERLALERVESILDRLGMLDHLRTFTPTRPGSGSTNPAPTFDDFVATVRSELESEVIPGSPAGAGLVVAPVGSVAGISFERVAVVGVVEGFFPRSARDDSLLGDQVRALAGGLLLPRSERPQLDLRTIAAIVAAAAGGVLLTTSRGDLRSRRSGAWPRVLDSLVAERTTIASHHRGLVAHGRPASRVDLELRSLVAHVDGGDPVHTHPLALTDAALSAGLTRDRERTKAVLNAYTGRVAAGLVDPVERVLSPTALESYAACPRRYLFDRVLRLGQDERPERVAEITARNRGTLMHRILERFIGAAVAEGGLPVPGDRWGPTAIASMSAMLDMTVQESAELGITGGRVQTEILRRDLRNEVNRFIETDNDLRFSRRARPYDVELAFGFDPEPAAVVQLADGRQLRLRGVIDRVDLTDDDGVLVIDYKGGSLQPYTRMDEDPLAGGRRLQLPLYARVIAERLERTGPRTALYWLTKHDKLRPIEFDDALDAQLEAHVGAALDGIAGGLFPGVPGGTMGWPRLTFENCQFCEFDRICPTDRQREWDLVGTDAQLTPVDLLLGRTT